MCTLALYLVCSLFKERIRQSTGLLYSFQPALGQHAWCW